MRSRVIVREPGTRSAPQLSTDEHVQPAQSKPVWLWSALGLGALTIMVVAGARWIAGGDFHAVDPGPDAYGGAAWVGALITQFVLLASAVAIIWHYGLRPILRERRFGFDSKLVFAGCLCGFWEPCASYLNAGHAYNAHLTNLGSWAQFIPGWRTPGAETLVTPLLFVFAMYIWFIAGFIFLGCWILDRLRARFPRWSSLSCFSALYVICLGLDFAFEMLILRTQIYVYPVAPRGGSLWAGSLYQYPVQSMVSGAAVLTALTALRWTRDEHGRSFVERGVHLLRPRLRTPAATLAVLGYASIAVVGLWMIPFNVFVGMQGSASSRLPTYLRHGSCGAGTSRACPGPLVPVPSKTSLSIRPDDPRIPRP